MKRNGNGFHTRHCRNGLALRCQKANKRKVGLNMNSRCGSECKFSACDINLVAVERGEYPKQTINYGANLFMFRVF